MIRIYKLLKFIMVKIVKGDLLNSNEEYIVQQCNCLTVSSHGLSKSISDKYGKWADPYCQRKRIGKRNLAQEQYRDKPGTIKILTSTPSDPKITTVQPNVVCIFGQWVPGVPGKYKTYPKWEIDNYENRLKWFEEALLSIPSDIKRLAFPYKIGCGLAGGNWNKYYKIIQKFEELSKCECIIYKL